MSLGDQVDRFLSEMHFLSPGLFLEGKSGHRWVTWGQHMAYGDVGSAYGGCVPWPAG